MMTYAQIDKLIAILGFGVLLYVVWFVLPFRLEWEARREQKAEAERLKREAEAAEAAANAEPAYHPVFTENREFKVPPLVVQHLTDKATLLMRYRRKKHASTAHLIVWSGAKRKTIQDSYFDLGLIQCEELNEEIIEQFVAAAKNKLAELAVAGKRKRRETQVAAAPVVEQVVEEMADPAIAEATQASAVVVEEAQATAVIVEDTAPEAIHLRKFPSVHRGVIEEVGMMKKNNAEVEYSVFGIRYRTTEGVCDAVYGTNLRDGLRQAGAGVGDTVEIIKIGRKTIEKGKAPMNLYSVTKIDPSQMNPN